MAMNVTVNITGNVGVVQTAEQIFNGTLPAPASLLEASQQIAGARQALTQIPELPAEKRNEADRHLAAAETAAKTAPQDKKTIAGHLDAAKKVLESAASVAGTVVKVIGAVAGIGAAVAGFVV